MVGVALKKIKGVDDEGMQVTDEERKTFGEIMGLVRRVIGEHFGLPK